MSPCDDWNLCRDTFTNMHARTAGPPIGTFVEVNVFDQHVLIDICRIAVFLRRRDFHHLRQAFSAGGRNQKGIMVVLNRVLRTNL